VIAFANISAAFENKKIRTMQIIISASALMSFPGLKELKSIMINLCCSRNTGNVRAASGLIIRAAFLIFIIIFPAYMRAMKKHMPMNSCTKILSSGKVMKQRANAQIPLIIAVM